MTSVSHSAAPYSSLRAAAFSVRAETEDDAAWIEAMHAVAFGPGRFARAAFRVRERFDTDPALNAVAEVDGERAASVRMTPISVGGHDGYMLGPLVTDPAYRNKGAGRALVRHVCEKALAGEGVAFVLLVGDAPYYGPLGFAPTTPYAITLPGPVDPNRVLVYSANRDLGATLAGPLARFGMRPAD